ncbi:hypothetical protein IJ750_03075 [bacterium]|nr:hypothetical protein [bacterium]
MKKNIALFLSAAIALTSGMAFAAKYTINKSGTVKTQTGQVVTSPANTTNQNVFNNFYSQEYIASNQVNSTQVGIIEIVMDYSGSMSNWIGVAKRSISTIISQIPPSTRVGFRVFGHDSNGNNPASIHTLQDVKKIVKNGNKFKVVTERGPIGTTAGACSATQQVAAITAVNSNALLSGMNSVDIGGATPLVYALDRAVYQDFANYDTSTPKKIILITDGGENCGGDPCAFAKSLMRKRSDVHIDVVLASSASRSLTCLSSTTGGHFYSVDNLSDFTSTMTRSMKAEPVIKDSKKQNYEFIGE